MKEQEKKPRPPASPNWKRQKNISDRVGGLATHVSLTREGRGKIGTFSVPRSGIHSLADAAQTISNKMQADIDAALKNGPVKEIKTNIPGEKLQPLEMKRMLAASFARKHTVIKFCRDLLRRGRPLTEAECDALLRMKKTMEEEKKNESPDSHSS